MWLLDANLDIHLLELLQRLGVNCDAAENRGWKSLRNGDLVSACWQSGFDTVLTRDQLFAESASRAWRTFPNLAVVIVTLPQLPSARYLEAFTAAWTNTPIDPRPGQITIWPPARAPISR